MLFHGSNKSIPMPSFGWGNPNNDYGRGFYMTEHPNLAAEWAVAVDRDGYINKYEIDQSKFIVCNLDSKTVLHWAATILKCRYEANEWGINAKDVKYLIDNFAITPSDYDIIIGNRADDAYFAIVESFANGTLSIQDLAQAVAFGEWGKQTVLISEKAFSAIQYIGCEFVSHKEWYESRRERNKRATGLYRKLLDDKAHLTRAERNLELKIRDIANEKLTESSQEIKSIFPEQDNISSKNERRVLIGEKCTSNMSEVQDDSDSEDIRPQL